MLETTIVGKLSLMQDHLAALQMVVPSACSCVLAPLQKVTLTVALCSDCIGISWAPAAPETRPSAC